MQTSRLLEQIQSDVAAVASVGDETSARVASQIAAALGPALRVRLQELATEAADELSPQLPEGRVEVRLQGGDPVLVYVEDTPAPRPAEPEGSESRITLRIPELLKGAVDAAAARDGSSVNGWLVQVISRSLETRSRRIGNRLTGFARS